MSGLAGQQANSQITRAILALDRPWCLVELKLDTFRVSYPRALLD